MRSLLLFVAVLLSAAEALPNRAFVAMNMSPGTDWGTAYPFADLMRQARPWMREDKAEVALDALGNVDPASCPVSAIVALRDYHLPLGTYVLTWSGSGQVAFAGRGLLTAGKVVKREPRRVELDLAADATLIVAITASDPQDPVRDVHCWLPGTEGQASPINPAYAARVAPFIAYRFMEWMEINGSRQQTWAGRPVPQQQTFRLKDRHGVPIEWMVALCNQNRADPWFCIPHLADDDYVRRFALLVKEALDPALRVHVEYSNETWNTAPGFEQSLYALERGRALGIKDGDRPGSSFTARRSLEIWAIWAEVFGGTDRLVRVMAGQASQAAVMERRLAYLDAAKQVDAIAIAPYAGFSADIKTAFDEKLKTPDAIIENIASQVEERTVGMVKAHAALAQKHGKRLIAYEGGLVFSLPTALKNDQGKLDLMFTAARSPRVEVLYRRYLQVWYGNGGGMFAAFHAIAPPGKWGCWGTLGEWLDQPDASAHQRRVLAGLLADPAAIPAGQRP